MPPAADPIGGPCQGLPRSRRPWPTGDMTDKTGMTDDEKRHDQLTRAPKSTEEDAAPRIEVTELENGVTRIDIADTAAVRPGADPSDV
jgi:hypothetical protein